MKSYTLDKLNEARDALNRDDHATCAAALDELITRMEIMMKPYDPKPLEELYNQTFDMDIGKEVKHERNTEG